MKVNIFTMYGSYDSIGGSQISAIALKEHLCGRGHDASIYSVSHTNRKRDEIKRTLSVDQILEFNKGIIILVDVPKQGVIDNIKIPFYSMFQSERDIISNIKVIEEIRSSKYFRGFMCLGKEPELGECFEWCPVIPPSTYHAEFIETRGLEFIYAGRVCEGKNPELFLHTANNLMPHISSASMHGKFLVTNSKPYGTGEGYRKKINSMLGMVEYNDAPYDRKALFKEKKFGFIWGIQGSVRHKVKYKRLELNVIEAVLHGIMPVIDILESPDEFHDMFISHDPLDDIRSLATQMKEWYNCDNKIRMLDEFNESSYGYFSIMNKFNKLLEWINETR